MGWHHSWSVTRWWDSKLGSRSSSIKNFWHGSAAFRLPGTFRAMSRCLGQFASTGGKDGIVMAYERGQSAVKRKTAFKSKNIKTTAWLILVETPLSRWHYQTGLCGGKRRYRPYMTRVTIFSTKTIWTTKKKNFGEKWGCGLWCLGHISCSGCVAHMSNVMWSIASHWSIATRWYDSKSKMQFIKMCCSVLFCGVLWGVLGGIGDIWSAVEMVWLVVGRGIVKRAIILSKIVAPPNVIICQHGWGHWCYWWSPVMLLQKPQRI